MGTIRASLTDIEPHLAEHIQRVWKGAPQGEILIDIATGWAIHPETGVRMGRSLLTQHLADSAKPTQKPTPLGEEDPAP